MKRSTIAIVIIALVGMIIASVALSSPSFQGITAPSTKTITTTTTKTTTTTTATTVNQTTTTTFRITVLVDRIDTVGADHISTTIITSSTAIPASQLVIPNQTEGTMDVAGVTYWFTDRNLTDQKQNFEFHGVKFTYEPIPLHILNVETSYNGMVKTLTVASSPPISSFKMEPQAILTNDLNGYQAGLIEIFGSRTIFLVRLT